MNSLRWGPWDSRHLLASAGADGLVQIFDPDTGTVVHRLDRHGANVPHLRWSPAGEYLATGDELGQVLVWSTKSGAVVRSLQVGGDAGLGGGSFGGGAWEGCNWLSAEAGGKHRKGAAA